MWLILATISLVLIVAATPPRFSMLLQDVYGYGPAVAEEGLSNRWLATYFTLIEVAIGISFILIASIVAWRKAEDRFAFMVATTLGYLWILLPLADGLVYADAQWQWMIMILRGLVYTGLIALLCLFPDGRFRPIWSRWFFLSWVLFVIVGREFLFQGFSDMAVIPNTSTIADSLILLGLSLWLGIGLIIQFIRYRTYATVEQQQQTKWVLYGFFLVISTGSVNALLLTLFPGLRTNPNLNLLYTLVGGTVIFLSVFGLALMIAIAIFRFRLWDIDILINRTLVYGSLTLVTIGIYVLIVGGAGAILQTWGSAVLAFVAAGFIAVLFQPLRSRLQAAVNRLMYGQRDDPVGMLTHLAHRLEAVDTPEEFLPTLVDTVAAALKLPYVALWLPRRDQHWEPVAVYGHPPKEQVVVPLLHQNQEIGRLAVAPRRPGERFSREDERLLATIAQLSATTLQAAQLSTELQQSRRQIVTGREEERRRLRRDLHDGLGPVLASVALQAETARDLVEMDPEETRLLLDNIRDQAQAAVTDVRRAVYDLRPPALDELGLVEALRQSTQAVQHRLPVTITAPELPPLPAAVEVAAYRIVQEAVHNVVTHAQATKCLISITLARDLHLVIEDNGVGLPEAVVSGVGLLSMKERAVELGGSCTVEGGPAGGTRVAAVLPLPPEEQT